MTDAVSALRAKFDACLPCEGKQEPSQLIVDKEVKALMLALDAKQVAALTEEFAAREWEVLFYPSWLLPDRCPPFFGFHKIADTRS